MSVQSMTTTKTADVEGTRPGPRVAGAGADIVRITCNDVEAAQPRRDRAVRRCRSWPTSTSVQAALAAMEAGVHGLRLNPGNIRNEARQTVAAPRTGACRSGSASTPAARQRPAGDTAGRPEAWWSRRSRRSATRGGRFHRHQDLGETFPPSMVAYRLLSEKVDYPAPGVTEAGPPPGGIIKSAAGIGRC